MVETAIVAPLFVTLVFWSAFFFDFVQIRLKVQEAARFAAWEFTAYPLSDYVGADHEAAYQRAATGVRARTREIYRSLRSEDRGPPQPRLTVTYAYEDVAFENEEVELVDSGLLRAPALPDGLGEVATTLLDGVDDARRLVSDRMRFDEKGVISATVTAKVRHGLMPRDAFTKENRGWLTKAMYSTAEYTLTDKATVLADAWTLHDGREVVPTRADAPYYDQSDLGFYAQVSRGHMLGLFDDVPLLGQLGNTVDSIADYIEDFLGIPSFTNAHLASASYEHASADDMIRLDTDERQKRFHTLPAREACTSPICAYDESEYSKTLRMRGDWYMGCPEPQHTPGACEWRDTN